jgi:hypothetical protein
MNNRQRSGPIEVVVTVAAGPDTENADSTSNPKSRFSSLAKGRVVERIVDLDRNPPRCERVTTNNIIEFWADDSLGVRVNDRVKVIQEDDGEFVLFWAEC